ncbi:RES family NAD+ phosphorylase [Ruegeria marina]|uniref:RES domain-containing protein n=1 Tax=Ruegeria marina TaxID=639004 RepID=A0A1G6W9F5_9RHOB|nr:RES family NAD+ phosphorylase [Ruegeria marina]SDD62333.1 hypothetical protein SAMN04488239_10916 [Ruegeria marina]
MPNVAADLPLRDINDDFFLLIPSRFPPVELFDRLSVTSTQEVADIESLTNPRLRAKERLSHRPDGYVDDQSPKLQNWNLAPFTYPNPEGTTLFPSSLRCLEMSGDIQTALAVAVAKREAFLGRTHEDAIGLDMRMLKRKVLGRFIDARGLTLAQAELNYRELGQQILSLEEEIRFDGVLFHSNERPSGTRVVVLNGDVLDRAIQCEHYRFHWDGSRISRIYNFDSSLPTAKNSIDPSALVGEENLFSD